MRYTIIEKITDVNLVNNIFLIFTIQINPTCGTFVSQSLQRHSYGTHFLIFLLKVSRDPELFTSFSKMCHIFGAKTKLF